MTGGTTTFTPREVKRQKVEVHIAGTGFRIDNDHTVSLLFARRSLERELFPGKLEGCGGQLLEDETFAQGVTRHFKQELNIDVQPLEDIHNFYAIKYGSYIIPGIHFLCKVIHMSQPTLIRHSEILWMKEAEFRNRPADDFTGTLQQDVIHLLDQLRLQN